MGARHRLFPPAVQSCSRSPEERKCQIMILQALSQSPARAQTLFESKTILRLRPSPTHRNRQQVGTRNPPRIKWHTRQEQNNIADSTLWKNLTTGSVGRTRKRYRIRKNLTYCLLYTSDAADDLLCVDLG